MTDRSRRDAGTADAQPGDTAATEAAITEVSIDPLERLRRATTARVALGRYGHGLPTQALLDFQLAHARARDAVHEHLDVDRLLSALASLSARSTGSAGLSDKADSGAPRSAQQPLSGGQQPLSGAEAPLVGAQAPLVVNSRAPDRQTYLQRPDLGRQLLEADTHRLIPGRYEAAIVIADGLSARAVHSHAVPLLQQLFDNISDWQLAPIVIATHARVALGDEIGSRLGADLVAVLIGERPGLSSPDSLGCYLTWHPRPGRQDSERNCISNIRPPAGLSYELAARRLAWLMRAARRERLTGVRLKDPDATDLLMPRAP